METNHVFSFYGYTEDERNRLITYDPDWHLFSNLCKTYQVYKSDARAWVDNDEVEHLQIGRTTYVERDSFVLRAYGLVTRCAVCSRVLWQSQNQPLCSRKCRNSYAYQKRAGQRYKHRNMWLIQSLSMMSFGEVVHKRRMQTRITLADYEKIVGESVAYLRLIESNNVPPPSNEATLQLYAKWLDIDVRTEAYSRFVELARHEASLWTPKEIHIDVDVRKTDFGFIAELATNYEERLRCYGKNKKDAVANLVSLLKIDISDRLRKGLSIFNLKGYKEKEVMIVVNDSWKI